MSNLLDKASIILTPTAYKNNEALCIKPSDGSGDFDFSRNSAATRVNAQGLVENVQILSSNLVQNGDFSEEGSEEVSNGSFSQEGSELTTNGDFSNGITGWTTSGSNPATVLNGTATVPSNSYIFQSGGIPASTQVKFIVEGTGKIRYRLGTEGYSGQIDMPFTLYVPTQSLGARVQLQNLSGGDVTITNVSLKEVGQDWILESGWSIGEDKAISDGSGSVPNTDLVQHNVFTNGKSYKVTLEIKDYISGNLQLQNNTTNFPQSNGIHTIYSSTGSTSLILRSLSFIGSITNISVKEVGQNWVLDANWSIAENKAVSDGSVNGLIRTSTNLFESGKTYKVGMTVSNMTTGRITYPYDGGGGTYVYTNGDFSKTYYADDTNKCWIYGSNGFDGSITNISVVEITDETNLPRINYENFSYQDALGSELVVNGTFDDGLNGWQPHVGSILELENGMAKVTVVGNQGFIRRNDLSIETGKTYFCKAYITNGTPPQWYINGTNNLLNLSLISENTYGAYVTVTGNNSFFYIRGSNTDGEVTFIDNVSVKEYLGQEVVPDSGCGSWLFEPESINLIPYSSDYTQWILGSQNVSIIPNNTISPSGLLDATKLIVGTSNNGIYQTFTSLASQYTGTMYIKTAIGTVDLKFGFFDGTTIDTDTITVTDTWTRFEVSKNLLASSSSRFWLYPATNGAKEVFIWGAQVEQQSYATSYIPNFGEANGVSRNQDVCTGGGSLASINSTSGTLYAEIAALANDGTNRAIAISDGSTSNVVRFYYSTTDNRIVGNVKSGGTTYFNFNNVLVSATDFIKVAVSYKINEFKMYVNGTLVFTDTSGNTPIGLNELAFDNGAGNDKFFGKTKCLAVFPYLSDSELQSLTTI